MLKRYFSMLRSEFSGYNLKSFSSDLMAGLTVTAVALPLALAFGVSCGAEGRFFKEKAPQKPFWGKVFYRPMG